MEGFRDAPGLVQFVVICWYFLVLLGIPYFLWAVPGNLGDIARQLRRIADAKEKKEDP